MHQWCRTFIDGAAIKIALFFFFFLFSPKKSLPLSKMPLGWVKKQSRWPDWPCGEHLWSVPKRYDKTGA